MRGEAAKATGTKHSRAAMLRMTRLRKARGWSARQLVDELLAIGKPISYSTISNYDALRRDHMTVDELFALAEVFKVSPTDLATNECQTCEGSPPNGFVCGSCGAREDE